MAHLKSRYFISIFLIVLNILFLTLFLGNKTFFEWAYGRHENIWSWYMRPVFLLVYGLMAYLRSLNGMLLALLLIFTSMFWFPKPAVVPEEISEFLRIEREWIMGNWDLFKGLEALMVPLGFVMITYALWRRKLWQGVLIISGLIIFKVCWSLVYGGATGTNIIVPALAGIVLTVILPLLLDKERNKNRQ